ncbi:MAG: VCBS repeat-containing protein, partial [Verrucomicrobiota bacterium]
MQLTPCLMGFLLCIAMPALRAALNSEPLLKPISGTTAFEPVDATTSGILFTNTLGEFAGASNRVLFNGSGLALGDVDGDGWVDVFFCGIDTPNQLYRNQGNWQFERQTLPEAMALPG